MARRQFQAQKAINNGISRREKSAAGSGGESRLHLLTHLQYPIDGRAADLEGLRDLRSATSPCAFISRTWAASIEAGRPLNTPAALALAMPSSWRSRRKLVSNSANTPSMSGKHLPAAVPVSIGCSVVLQGAAGLVNHVALVGHSIGFPRLGAGPRLPHFLLTY